MKTHLSSRIMPLTLAVVYFFNNALWAGRYEKSFWEEHWQAVHRAHVQATSSPMSPSTSIHPPPFEMGLPSVAELDDLLKNLPSSYGSFRRVSVPKGQKNPKIIIHIQDVHMNLEAQSNIGLVLQALIKENQIDLLALEGAFAPIDLTTLRHFPDQHAIRKVADYFLKINQISGPIHSALTSPRIIPSVVGVDDPIQYQSNVAAYKQAAPRVEIFKRELFIQEKILTERKRRSFNTQLLSFDNQVEAYRAGQLYIGDYCRILSQVSPRILPSVLAFMKALHMESSLNFTQVERERTLLIAHLIEKLDRRQTSDFLSASTAYQREQFHRKDFYRDLRALCHKKNIDLAHYPAMEAYLRYVFLSDRVEAEKVFDEIRQMEKWSYTTLIQTPQEERLVVDSRRAHLTKKLVEFSLTSKEWQEYKETLRACLKAPRGRRPGTLFGRDPGSTVGNTWVPYRSIMILVSAYRHYANQWIDTARGMPGRRHFIPPLKSKPTSLKPFESFYEQAELRDHAMVSNLLKEMEQKKATVAVLVAGGFHAPGIEKFASASGAAFISYVPKITQVNSENGATYLSIFAQEKTPLDKLFEGERLNLAKPPLPKQTNLAFGLLTRLFLEARNPNRPVPAKIERDIHRWFPPHFRLLTWDEKNGTSSGILAVPDGAPLRMEMSIKNDSIERFNVFIAEELKFFIINTLGWSISLAISDPLIAIVVRILFFLIGALDYGFSHQNIFRREFRDIVWVRAANSADKMNFMLLGGLFQIGSLLPLPNFLMGPVAHLFYNQFLTRLFPRLWLGMGKSIAEGVQTEKEKGLIGSSMARRSKKDYLKMLPWIITGFVGFLLVLRHRGWTMFLPKSDDVIQWHEKWTPVAEFWSYVATILALVAVPIALWEIWTQNNKERENEEGETFQRLTDAYRDVLKLISDHPDLKLRTQTLPDENLTPEQIETRQTIFESLISLFEEAHILLYTADMDKAAQERWDTWQDYMREWLLRPDFRQALPKLLIGENEDFAAYILDLNKEGTLSPEDASDEPQDPSLLATWTVKKLQQEGFDPNSFWGKVVKGPWYETRWYLLSGHGIGLGLWVGLELSRALFDLDPVIIQTTLHIFYAVWVLGWTGLKFALDHQTQRSKKVFLGLLIGLLSFSPIFYWLSSDFSLTVMNLGFAIFLTMGGTTLAHLIHTGINFKALVNLKPNRLNLGLHRILPTKPKASALFRRWLGYCIGLAIGSLVVIQQGIGELGLLIFMTPLAGIILYAQLNRELIVDRFPTFGHKVGEDSPNETIAPEPDLQFSKNNTLIEKRLQSFFNSFRSPGNEEFHLVKGARETPWLILIEDLNHNLLARVEFVINVALPIQAIGLQMDWRDETLTLKTKGDILKHLITKIVQSDLEIELICIDGVRLQETPFFRAKGEEVIWKFSEDQPVAEFSLSEDSEQWEGTSPNSQGLSLLPHNRTWEIHVDKVANLAAILDILILSGAAEFTGAIVLHDDENDLADFNDVPVIPADKKEGEETAQKQLPWPPPMTSVAQNPIEFPEKSPKEVRENNLSVQSAKFENKVGDKPPEIYVLFSPNLRQGPNQLVKLSGKKVQQDIVHNFARPLFLTPDLTFPQPQNEPSGPVESIMDRLRAQVNTNGINEIASRKIIAFLDYQLQIARNMEGRILFSATPDSETIYEETQPGGINIFIDQQGQALPKDDWVQMIMDDGSHISVGSSKPHGNIHVHIIDKGPHHSQWRENVKKWLVAFKHPFQKSTVAYSPLGVGIFAVFSVAYEWGYLDILSLQILAGTLFLVSVLTGPIWGPKPTMNGLAKTRPQRNQPLPIPKRRIGKRYFGDLLIQIRILKSSS